MDEDLRHDLYGRLGYDLVSALCLCKDLSADDVSNMIMEITGENDGADWHWIVKLYDGKYAYVAGGCDYTGWDCQAEAEAFLAPSYEEVMKLVPQDFRRVFEDMFAKGEKFRAAGAA